MWKEFKEFAFKGNVLDMAVGVIIGGAFSKIVTSLVNDVLMPVVGSLVSGSDLSALKWVLHPAVLDEAGEVVKAEAAILYGSFLQNVVDFLIVAACIFFFVKLIGAMKKKPEPQPAKPAAPTAEELLAEIRDLMKKER